MLLNGNILDIYLAFEIKPVKGLLHSCCVLVYKHLSTVFLWL